MPATIETRRERADSPVARGLVAAMEAEVDQVFGAPRMPTSARPEQLSPPDGAFAVLYEDGRPVAGGGLKRLGPEVCEVKRMYVEPRARSRGHARRLLVALEEAARDLGYARVRLDSAARQPHAIALYRSAGYREIPDYNGNPLADYWGEKVL
ncbi:MAG TPA: GNAT family N-acetyltransferase [Solirubrobacteraceae bacterium]|nr:GNAT family N-acetyltransferase [Solirubrobacteraceae bacterium]